MGAIVNRLFRRFLAPVFLSIALATVLVYIVIAWIFGDPLQQNAVRQAAPQIFLLEHYIDKAPNDEWLQRLNKVREVSQVKFDLIPLNQALSQLSAAQHQTLISGAIVIDFSHKSFYRRVDLGGNRYVGSDEDVLLAQNLPMDYWLNVQMELVRYVIVALVLLIPIAFWSRAHWREVEALAKVTHAFGAGQLSVRATTSSKASIYPLAQQINDMAERIEHLLEAQKNLMHAVSHELRTPIARLEFGLEIMYDGMQDAPTRGRIDAMRGDLSELNSLVSELLELAKVDQSEALPMTLMLATDLIHNCLEHLPPRPAHLQLKLELPDEALQIEGDSRLLTRAIVNLLKNAFKYAESTIILRCAKSDRGQCILVVEDDGPGIPESERSKIFEAFYRLDRSRDRSTGGFGLGLSIVRQIVQLHRAQIRVSASNLGGAQFELTFHPARASVLAPMEKLV